MPGRTEQRCKTKKKQKRKNPVTYQNKDVISKIFGENMKNKSFSAYGAKLPEITAVLPTNLPAVEANELRVDNLFRLKDHSLAIVDYESTYKHTAKIKYLSYIVRTLKRNAADGTIKQKIRMIVIYTGDIVRVSTNPELDIGCLKFIVEEIFLSELEPEAIEEHLTEKIDSDQVLTEEEQMQFIILPLIYKKKDEMQKCIKRCFDLAKKVSSQSLQDFLLSGLLVFSDKIITRDDSESIKRWIMMTKVARLFEDEKMKAVKETRKETRKETQKETELRIAGNMVSRGYSVEEALSFTTVVSEEELNQFQKDKM